MWRDAFREVRDRASATPKVGLIKLKTISGERRYAVAVCDGSDLWLTLWVRRSRKPEFFVMVPRGDSGWDPHTSYHNDGKLHMKSHGTKLDVRQRQLLTEPFRGTEHLGVYLGHQAKSVGAICDPTAFSGIVRGCTRRAGATPRPSVIVDLVEPGCQPMPCDNVIQQEIFCDFLPWVVIRIASWNRRNVTATFELVEPLHGRTSPRLRTRPPPFGGASSSSASSASATRSMATARRAAAQFRWPIAIV